jgi:hypothetical protein
VKVTYYVKGVMEQNVHTRMRYKHTGYTTHDKEKRKSEAKEKWYFHNEYAVYDSNTSVH